MILDILSCIQKTQYLDICSISNVAIVKNDCTVTSRKTNAEINLVLILGKYRMLILNLG